MVALLGAVVLPGAVGGAVPAGATPPGPAGGPAGGAATVVGSPGSGPGPSIAQDPVSLAVAPSGALLIGDGTLMVVRSLAPTGAETTAACSGDIATRGFGGDGGPATDASCDNPWGLATDRTGDLFVADNQNNRIRVVASASGSPFGVPTAAGAMATVAGTGTWGAGGDGGPATGAQLAYPAGIALDPAGNLVIDDSGNAEIRVVAAATGTFYGQAMTAGDIYTVAGTGTTGHGGDGGPAVRAELDQPAGVAVDSHGNLVFADLGNSEIRVVAAATGTFYGQAMTAGDIYTVAGTGTTGHGGDGGPAVRAELDHPDGVAVDGRGDIVIADTGNNRVRLVAATDGTVFGRAVTAGHLYTVAGTGAGRFAGDGGPAVRASLDRPEAVAVDRGGDIVVADSGNDRVRVVAARTTTAFGRHLVAGTIGTVAGTGRAGGFSGDGGPAAGAVLNLPTDVAVDGSGGVAVADQNNNRVRYVPAHTGRAFGRLLTAGRITTLLGDGRAGSSGLGGSGTAAEVDAPSGVAFDHHGNLIVAVFAGNRLIVVAATDGTFYGRAMRAGHAYLLAGTGAVGSRGDGGPATAAQLDAPEHVTVDRAGDVLVSEFYGNRVRLIAARSGTAFGRPVSADHIYTVAGNGSDASSGDGGPATAASLDHPLGVAVDGRGDLVVSDYLGERVRMVAATTGIAFGRPVTAGDIYTVAGDGTKGSSGDGGPGPSAQLSYPAGVAVDGAGDLVVADSVDGTVRVVAATTGDHYGVSMTAGDIYTVAGGGTVGCQGAVGTLLSPTAITLSAPLGVAVAPDGAILVTDTADNCVRSFPGPTGGGTP